MRNADLINRDLSVLWRPCTQMNNPEWLPVIPVRRGEGVWLENFKSRRYLDAISSWWVNLFGHSNPRINAALSKHLDTLEPALLAGFTHETVNELSERLVGKTPEGLDRCFYANNGSSDIDLSTRDQAPRPQCA